MRLLLSLCGASACLLAAAVPRPEYPQPQFQRDQWISLNGRWEFDFDDQDTGLRDHWADGARPFGKSILVPFCFESANSGIGDTGFHRVVWYRRALEIPAAWKGRRVLLHFGAVDYRAMVWLNGKLLGSHQGGTVPFRFDIAGQLQSGANTLVVRAEDPPTDRYIPRGKQYWEPQSRGIFYTRTSGIWQPVWLEAAGDSYLEGVRITPSADGSVRFAARVARPLAGATLRVTISHNGKPVTSTEASAEDVRAVAMAAVPDPRLWNVNQPNLYDVLFELRRAGQVQDKVQSYFGFRTVTVENGRMFLNGRPVYLKLVLDQGYWPESILTPPSDEAIQSDIRAAKEMGFNGARKHQKVEDPRYLYWADRLGFLVSGETANAYLFDEEYASAFTREWMEAVERDYNHPSIVIWAPLNESWGTPNLRDPAQQNHLRALYALTKSLDSTRPVIDNEGWEHTDMTDLFAFHDYARTGELLFDKYKNLGQTGARVPDNARAALIPGYRYNGSPFYLSEFGGIAFIPPGHQVPKESWGYSGVEKTAEDALLRLGGLYRAIARIPAITGICYTQLTDVEQEVNGLLTYGRKPKFDPKKIRELNDLLR
ncbi:MAG: glycoside hydrolase family 2 [Candidatus Solibacter usitatus]|nr:glycoside hydrolase family 2 [Candidatus Solibacter usitatus]